MTPPRKPIPTARRHPSSAAEPPRHAINAAWLSQQPWLGYILPLAVYMLVGSLEPASDKPFEMAGLTIPYSAYPLVYTIKLALTAAAVALVWPTYRQFPLRVSWLAPVVGAVGIVLWVGIAELGLEDTLLTPLGLGWFVSTGQRSAFNPLAEWPDQPLAAYGFLGVRFIGLVLVVPLIEEFFLRGFAMRFVVTADWWKVPFGTYTPAAAAVGILLPVLTHPGEVFAALAWFALVTWLTFRTKNIWDCVVAHMVTNLLLGIYVLASGHWRLM